MSPANPNEGVRSPDALVSPPTEAGPASLPKLAYLPFGGGNRVCIGEGFAWAEGILVLATLAQQWRLRPAGTGPVGYRAMLTLRPRGGLPMRLERRRRS